MNTYKIESQIKQGGSGHLFRDTIREILDAKNKEKRDYLEGSLKHDSAQLEMNLNG